MAKRTSQPEPVSAPVAAAPAVLPVWCVDIPGCLLKERFVAAATKEEAVDKYKKPCGITAHAQPPVVTPCEFDADHVPEDVTLWGD